MRKNCGNGEIKMGVNRVSITINSRQYTVIAAESADYIQRLGNHINEKVETVIKGGQNIMGERPVVLAALNICDEYFKTVEESKHFEDMAKRSADQNTYLEQRNYELKKQIEEMGSTQISIDETALKAEAVSAKRELADAKNQIKFLEGHIKNLESQLAAAKRR